MFACAVARFDAEMESVTHHRVKWIVFFSILTAAVCPLLFHLSRAQEGENESSPPSSVEDEKVAEDSDNIRGGIMSFEKCILEHFVAVI